MFRPFEQLGSDRSGLGVGLAISRQAIEADRGTLTVRDKPGKGCIFIVEMPRAFVDPIRRSRGILTSPPQ
jgi:signal transduction histidine kinase